MGELHWHKWWESEFSVQFHITQWAAGALAKGGVGRWELTSILIRTEGLALCGGNEGLRYRTQDPTGQAHEGSCQTGVDNRGENPAGMPTGNTSPLISPRLLTSKEGAGAPLTCMG